MELITTPISNCTVHPIQNVNILSRCSSIDTTIIIVRTSVESVYLELGDDYLIVTRKISCDTTFFSLNGGTDNDVATTGSDGQRTQHATDGQSRDLQRSTLETLLL